MAALNFGVKSLWNVDKNVSTSYLLLGTGKLSDYLYLLLKVLYLNTCKNISGVDLIQSDATLKLLSSQEFPPLCFLHPLSFSIPTDRTSMNYKTSLQIILALHINFNDQCYIHLLYIITFKYQREWPTWKKRKPTWTTTKNQFMESRDVCMYDIPKVTRWSISNKHNIDRHFLNFIICTILKH